MEELVSGYYVIGVVEWEGETFDTIVDGPYIDKRDADAASFENGTTWVEYLDEEAFGNAES